MEAYMPGENPGINSLLLAIKEPAVLQPTQVLIDTFLFLPQVKLQLNNPRKEKIIGDVSTFEISYQYEFNNNQSACKEIWFNGSNKRAQYRPFHSNWLPVYLLLNRSLLKISFQYLLLMLPAT